MQFSTLILSLASGAAIVAAIAIPAVISTEIEERSADAEARFCGRPGEPCWVKVKRDAIPEAEARFCGRPGEPCWVKVKRGAIPDAEARFCGRPGEPCWVKVRRDNE